MDKCKTLKNGTFIPGCMGAAARGKDYCTCEPAPDEGLGESSSQGHNPSDLWEKAPKVSHTEWLTRDEVDLAVELCAHFGTEPAFEIGEALTRKLAEGKLPVVAKADVEYIYSEGKKDPYSREFMLQRLADLLNGGAE